MFETLRLPSVSLIISLIDESLVSESCYRPENSCIAENHRKQLLYEGVMRKLLGQAKLMLKNITFHNMGDGPPHHLTQSGLGYEFAPLNKNCGRGTRPPGPRS